MKTDLADHPFGVSQHLRRGWLAKPYVRRDVAMKLHPKVATERL
jgi:hypothetical protein